jgi:hypothetical protein
VQGGSGLGILPRNDCGSWLRVTEDRLTVLVCFAAMKRIASQQISSSAIPSNRIPSLDGLRAVSISRVVAGHWAELRYHSDVAGAFANLGVHIFLLFPDI